MEDLKDLINQKVEEIEQKTLEDVVNEMYDNISKYIDDWVADILEKKIDALFFNDDVHLEDYIIKATSGIIADWYQKNLGYDDMKWCLKKTMVKHLSNLSFDELLEITKQVAKNE